MTTVSQRRATRAPRARTQKAAKPRSPIRPPVRYAVVGLGYIAQAAVLPAFAHARRNSELTALVSDDPVKLKKLARDYDATNKWRALELLEEARTKQEFLTGLLYINESRATLPDLMHITETPLAQLPEAKLRPSREAFAKVMAELM